MVQYQLAARQKISESTILTFWIREAVDEAQQFFGEEDEKIDPPPANPHPSAFWIVGYDSGEQDSEIWKIEIRNGEQLQPRVVASKNVMDQIFWGGQTNAISRLLLGFDPAQETILQAHELDKGQLQSIYTDLLKVRTLLFHPSMPIQDAIDLADIMVDLTKRYTVYRHQADMVWLQEARTSQRLLNTRDSSGSDGNTTIPPT